MAFSDAKSPWLGAALRTRRFGGGRFIWVFLSGGAVEGFWAFRARAGPLGLSVFGVQGRGPWGCFGHVVNTGTPKHRAGECSAHVA